ncbi:hypothetical protein [Cytobacillus horneckiae]|uniref:hypothetical protein n=1 Tax=Cytobacillus horneckiae TaxID=549687 RepID=UPI003D1F98F2
MAQATQSKILSIEEQIKKLQEKKKREIAKLERNIGKKFLETFKLEDKSSEEIISFIQQLKEETRSPINADSMTNITNEKPDQ